jgi:competence protein ComEC
MSIFENKIINILIIVSAVLILAWVWVFVEEREGKFLEIDFFDVGQGDAIFIETPKHKQILVDGGPDLTILEKLGREMPFWDRYIDLIVLSHPEADHLTGLIEVAKRYKIGGILTTGIVRETAQYEEWQKVIQEENIPIYIAQADGVVNLDNDIKLFVLYPFENLSGKIIKESNNTSIVAKLVFKDFELLLTGDIEKKVEKKLVNSRTNLASDILKIAHHGSKTSSTNEFINAVSPMVAIIQAGKDNSYGHPHRSVLDALNSIIAFVTGRDGDIEILTDGTKFQIR